MRKTFEDFTDRYEVTRILREEELQVEKTIVSEPEEESREAVEDKEISEDYTLEVEKTEAVQPMEESPNLLTKEKTVSLEISGKCFEIASSSVIGTREYQQDAVRTKVFEGQEEKDDFAVGVLCDGMGGMEGGEYASNFAADQLLGMVEKGVTSWSEFFEETVRKLNEDVKNLHNEKGEKLRAGTTLTCVVVDKKGCFWCSVGDSRIYLMRKKQLIQLTMDHNYETTMKAMLELGKIKPEHINPNEKKEALTSYLGIPQITQIGVTRKQMVLEEGDLLLQCSDGLYRALDDQEILDILTQISDVEQAAEALTSLASMIPGAHDNISVVLTRYKGTEEGTVHSLYK